MLKLSKDNIMTIDPISVTLENAGNKPIAITSIELSILAYNIDDNGKRTSNEDGLWSAPKLGNFVPFTEEPGKIDVKTFNVLGSYSFSNVADLTKYWAMEIHFTVTRSSINTGRFNIDTLVGEIYETKEMKELDPDPIGTFSFDRSSVPIHLVRKHWPFY
jgi:hypothetical protein